MAHELDMPSFGVDQGKKIMGGREVRGKFSRQLLTMLRTYEIRCLRLVWLQSQRLGLQISIMPSWILKEGMIPKWLQFH
ncbi:hypothetical protein QYF36_019854 [Acer negundo]|nr:hypothetical protein QYF36_019854 [Acer negundo]